MGSLFNKKQHTEPESEAERDQRLKELIHEQITNRKAEIAQYVKEYINKGFYNEKPLLFNYLFEKVFPAQQGFEIAFNQLKLRINGVTVSQLGYFSIVYEQGGFYFVKFYPVDERRFYHE